MIDSPRHHSILIIHNELESIESFVDSLEDKGLKVTAAPDSKMSLSQPEYRKYDLIVISSEITSTPAVQFLQRLKADPVMNLVPVLISAPDDRAGAAIHAEWVMEGAEMLIPESMHHSEKAELVNHFLRKCDRERKDPITGMLTGPVLHSILENMCTSSETDWYFVAVKLLGVQAYNLANGFDAGDNMLAKFGQTLRELIEEQGEKTDICGRLGGSVFCVITRSRRIDSICRNVLVRCERMIRSFYTAFELMKGYVTVEDGPGAGDYHLAEATIGAIQVPPRWNNNHVYLTDLAEELLMDVLKHEAGYRIITP